MEKCNKCGNKPPEKGRKICGSCRWAARSPESKRNHERRKFFRKYGLSQEQLEALHAKHKVCAICSAETELVVDHNHNTGKVRGLLCARCNLGLGHFSDDPNNLIKAANYLVKE